MSTNISAETRLVVVQVQGEYTASWACTTPVCAHKLPAVDVEQGCRGARPTITRTRSGGGASK